MGTAAPGCPASASSQVFRPSKERPHCGALLRPTAGGGCRHASLMWDSPATASSENSSWPTASKYNFSCGLSVVMPKAFYRRRLPHLQRDDKPHFLTFCTHHRWMLPEHIRSLVLDCCLHDHGSKIDLHVAVVMPDHVHMIFTPLTAAERLEVYPLAEITGAIKGASAHNINRALDRERPSLAGRIVGSCSAVFREPGREGPVRAGKPGSSRFG